MDILDCEVQLPRRVGLVDEAVVIARNHLYFGQEEGVQGLVEPSKGHGRTPLSSVQFSRLLPQPSPQTFQCTVQDLGHLCEPSTDFWRENIG
jgi:hypothetical protein